MTNTAGTLNWSVEAPCWYIAPSETFPYSEWYVDVEDAPGAELHLCRTDPEGTTPDQSYGFFSSVEAAQARAQLIEDGEW